jgi:cold shock protein
LHVKIKFYFCLFYQLILIIMFTGVVKFFNDRKGYGFIVDDETQKEIFVHITGLVDKVKEADKVGYDVTEDNRGMKAINVKKI